MILQFILFILLLFVIFRLANFLQKQFVFRQKYVQLLHSVLPMAELLVYLITVAWFFNYTEGYSVGYKIFIAFCAIVLLALLTWFVLKDFVSGLVFRAKTGVRTGNEVFINGKPAKVSSVGLLHLGVENSNGETEILSYAKLNESGFSSSKLQKNNFSVQLSVSFPVAYNVSKLKQKVSAELINCPYVLSKIKPEILSETIENDKITFCINVHLLEKEHAELVKNYLNKLILP